MTVPHSAADLQQLCRTRFAGKSEYRRRVWAILSQLFSRRISAEADALDLGCAWYEFINSVNCRLKFGMDLNPDAKTFAEPGVGFLEQDRSVTLGNGDGKSRRSVYEQFSGAFAGEVRAGKYSR
jgi:hypothetical protein